MQRRARPGRAGVLLLSLLVASSFLASVSFSEPASASRSNSVNPETAISGVLRAEVLSALSTVANRTNLSAASRAKLVAHVSSMSPSEILREAGMDPRVIAEFNWGQFENVLAAFGGGCAVGAVFGAAAGGPIGAGVGCVVVGAALDIAYEWGTYQSTTVNYQTDTFPQAAVANIAYASSDWNTTNAEFETLGSALNFSLVAFERMADAAAVLQLGNSTFSTAQDAFQSGLATQFSTIGAAYFYQFGQPYLLLNEWANAQLGGSGAYQSTHGKFCGDVAGQTAAAACMRPNGVNPSLELEGGTLGTSNETVYIPPNTTAAYVVGTSSSPGTAYFKAILGGSWVGVSPTNTSLLSDGRTIWKYSYTFDAGYYQLDVPGSYTYIPGADVFATSSSVNILAQPSGNSYATLVFAGPSFNGTGLINSYPTAGGVVYFTNSGSTITYTPAPLSSPTAVNFGEWLGYLEYEATANGQSYWSFLRGLGYTSISQVPPDCIIPEPWQAVPASLNLGNLSAQEDESLYQTWLLGLARFYNDTGLPTTSFCTQTGTHWPKYTVNSTIWGNLQVNATGYVYLNNGSAPISSAGKYLGSEKYGNLSTWAVVGQQLLIMPTISSIAIPVGTRWSVPANDPVEIFILYEDTLLYATGNGSYGTLPEVRLEATALPGDSIYLTSCSVGGTAESNCTVAVQNITVTTTQLNCLGSGPSSPFSCQKQASNASAGSPWWSIGNPFAALASWLSSLFGGGPLGQLLGEIAAALLVVGVLLLLVYVVVVEVENWGSRKSSGGGGSAGANSRGVAPVPFSGALLGSERPRGGQRRIRDRQGKWHADAVVVLGIFLAAAGALFVLLDGVITLTGPALLIAGLIFLVLGLISEAAEAEKKR